MTYIRMVMMALPMALVGVLASCSVDDDVQTTLSGDGQKTPLNVAASLSNGGIQSRAAGKEFDKDDILLAYLRHTTGGARGSYTTVAADKAPKLVSFKYNGADLEEVDDNTNKTSDLTVEGGLYWDDFSYSTSPDTDLRTSGHGLQSYYGYCYNGGNGNISTALTPETGALGWTVPTEQSSADIVKKADLLWSAEQETVEYAHSTANEGVDHNALTIPYTHAMSEITINLTVDKGYEDVENPLASTIVTLQNFNKVGTFTAPTAAISGTSTDNIQMFGAEPKDKTRTYVAMTVPQTNLTVGNVLAKVTNVDGNNYFIPVTKEILNSWAEQLEVADEVHQDGGSIAGAKSRATIPDGKAGLTKPGVNYVLNVTLSKVAIKVEARISDWISVNASTNAIIDYNHDVVNFDFTNNNFKNADAFRIYATEEGSAASKSTVVTYTAEPVPGKWTASDNIYWPNGTTKMKFRAIATKDGEAYKEKNELAAAQGTDVIWATTAQHNGTAEDGTTFSYDAGDYISPRTGNVPMQFEHAMSKISVNLTTSTNEAAKVNLTGAKISISNLSTSGEINIETGDITTGGNVVAAISDMTSIADYCVIPQAITDASVMTITLADGTTYKLKLSECKDADDAAVTEWLRGKHYTYTIYLEKEKITFRALIKEWDEKEGSGNANLEWD